MSKSVWTGTYYDGGSPISDGQYWEGEARLGVMWNAEEGRHEPCGGWILTNMDTWIRCPICPCTSGYPEYESIGLSEEEMNWHDLCDVLERTMQ